MGGYVALAMAKAQPGRLSGLGLVCTQARGDTPAEQQKRRETAEKVQEQGVAMIQEAMAVREDLVPYLSELRIPTLVLTGKEVQVIPPARSQEMANLIPKATLIEVAEAGHIPGS